MSLKDTVPPLVRTNTKTVKDSRKQKRPIWIKYEPRFWPWVEINEGGLLGITHDLKLPGKNGRGISVVIRQW